MVVSGEKLKKLRKKAGLSQSDLAEKLGRRTRACVCDWEKERRSVPLKYHEKIAETLGINMLQLSKESPENEPVELDDKQRFIVTHLHLLTDRELVDLLVKLASRKD